MKDVLSRFIKPIIAICVMLVLFGCSSDKLPDDYPTFNEDGILFELNGHENEFKDKLYYRQLTETNKKYYQCFYDASIQYKTYFDFNYEYSFDDIVEVSQVFMLDFPEYYWWNDFTIFEEKLFNTSGKEYVYSKLSSGEFFAYIIEEDSLKIEEKGDEIINIVKADNDYDTLKNLHDYIINNTSYNIESISNQNLRSSLLNDESVCAGYSEVFQYIANRLGYECYSVVGESLPKLEDGYLHEWNIIKIEDKWYWIDVTWDESIDRNGNELKPRYEYFLASDDVFDINHIPNDVYEYPKCSDNILYFKNEPTIFVENLDFSYINDVEISWLKNGYHRFGFKVKDYNDFLSLKDYVYNGFVELYRNNIDPYCGINYEMTWDDNSHYMEFYFSTY